MRILFMGTPEYAVPSLKALISSDDEVVGVITQMDKPKGRGYIMTPPPVKVCATEAGIPVWQPQTLKDDAFFSLLESIRPDLIVVVAFGKILPKNVLDYPKFGCINVHGSLLPKYRGAAPMQRAIINGEKETGVTTMYMDVGLDTGDMLLCEKISIEEEDNFENIHDKLAEAGARVLIDTLRELKAGTLVRHKQPSDGATYAAKIEKEDCALDFSRTATELHNQIRGMSPFPLAFTHMPDGKLLKIVKASVRSSEGTHSIPGEIQAGSVSGGHLLVSCGTGTLELLTVLPEGKGRMSASDFLRGRKLSDGDVLH